jgi:hypothetical protein
MNHTIQTARALIRGLIDDGTISSDEGTRALSHFARSGDLWIRVDDHTERIMPDGTRRSAANIRRRSQIRYDQ